MRPVYFVECGLVEACPEASVFCGVFSANPVFIVECVLVYV